MTTAIMIRYVIKVVEQTARGNETRLLYAGPLDNTKAVFGVGKFHLFAGKVSCKVTRC